ACRPDGRPGVVTQRSPTRRRGVCMMAACPNPKFRARIPSRPGPCAAFLFPLLSARLHSMPLPKPPATRAALLSAADYESQSAPKPARRAQKAQAQAEPTPKLLDLRDDRPETAVGRRPPAAPAARAPFPRTPGQTTGPAPV